MEYYSDYRAHRGADPNRFFKTTLFSSQRVLLGLNCLAPGQTQVVHTHATQDKFYFVLEGQGAFHVAGEERICEAGTAVWAPAGVPHGVSNGGSADLVVLVGIAPAPGS